MEAFAILGIHPELSRAELEAVTGVEMELASSEAAVFSLPGAPKAVPSPGSPKGRELLEDLQRRLGGTQKLGWIVGRCSEANLSKKLFELWNETDDQGKFPFGLSVYELGNPSGSKKLRSQTQRIGLQLKKQLKKGGRSLRLVTSKDPTLSTVVVSKNGMHKNGGELVLLVKDKQILVGRTITVQDFEDWSTRDYDRPARDAKSGMLPPKLARMMINLSGASADSVLLDPFCGSGTVLMEGGILGIKTMVGADISEKAVEDSGTNLAWLEKGGYPVGEVDLYLSPAAELDQYVEPESVDVIVTEPFLGKPRSGKESAKKIQTSVDELTTLYKESFEALAKLLRPGGTMVIASPVHMVEKQQIPVPTTEILSNLNFNLQPSTSQLLYHRKGQFVARSIIVARK